MIEVYLSIAILVAYVSSMYIAMVFFTDHYDLHNIKTKQNLHRAEMFLVMAIVWPVIPIYYLTTSKKDKNINV